MPNYEKMYYLLMNKLEEEIVRLQKIYKQMQEFYTEMDEEFLNHLNIREPAKRDDW